MITSYYVCNFVITHNHKYFTLFAFCSFTCRAEHGTSRFTATIKLSFFIFGLTMTIFFLSFHISDFTKHPRQYSYGENSFTETFFFDLVVLKACFFLYHFEQGVSVQCDLLLFSPNEFGFKSHLLHKRSNFFLPNLSFQIVQIRPFIS